MSGGLKEVRERITSVNSTQQITKAMKMVSAAKLKKASDAINDMRPYSLKLNSMLSNVMASLGPDEELPNLEYAEQREVKHVTLVVITSDRGLAGAFNTNLIKKAKQRIAEFSDKQIQLVTIGKKGNDAFKAGELDVNADFIDLFKALNFDHVSEASQFLLNEFVSGNTDRVEVIFGEFKNAATQIIQSDQFLPVNIASEEEAADNDSGYQADYLFEPNKEELLSVLVPKILRTQFYRYMLENNASEHGARMLAMEQATENANELLRELKLSYNRARQAAITKEISEIAGGVAALEG